MAGRIIAIEGGDGSGKTIQSKRLVAYLKQQNKIVRYIEFPRYQTFYGKLIERFLAGEFGSLEDTSPYFAALPYAFDRMHARGQIRQWLADGDTIVANRYVPSSVAHQAAKVPEEKREDLISWIEKMEYEINAVPKPNIVLYLHIPWKVGLSLSEEQGKSDIAEKDLYHRKTVEEVYVDLTKKRQNWTEITCMKEGNLMTPDEIHASIIRILHDT